MKNLFNKFKKALNLWLSKQKWYQWGVKNEVKAHYYIIFGVGLLTLPLWPILNSLGCAFLTTGTLSIFLMALREFTNESGWSWTDIFNGTVGYITAAFIVNLIAIAYYFIMSFSQQFY
jgi:hypothetical protein